MPTPRPLSVVAAWVCTQIPESKFLVVGWAGAAMKIAAIGVVSYVDAVGFGVVKVRAFAELLAGNTAPPANNCETVACRVDRPVGLAIFIWSTRLLSVPTPRNTANANS